MDVSFSTWLTKFDNVVHTFRRFSSTSWDHAIREELTDELKTLFEFKDDLVKLAAFHKKALKDKTSVPAIFSPQPKISSIPSSPSVASIKVKRTIRPPKQKDAPSEIDETVIPPKSNQPKSKKQKIPLKIKIFPFVQKPQILHIQFRCLIQHRIHNQHGNTKLKDGLSMVKALLKTILTMKQVL